MQCGGAVSWASITSTVKAVALTWPKPALESQHGQQEGAAAGFGSSWENQWLVQCPAQVHCIQMSPPAQQLLKALPKLPQKKGRDHPKAAPKSLLQSLLLSPLLQAACNEHVHISAMCSHFKGTAPNQLHLKKSSNF